MSETRRRNQRLFAFLAERATDAELRTLLECVKDEMEFRQEREHRTLKWGEEPVTEEHAPRAPHRNHAAERAQRKERTESGTRKATGT